MPDLATSVRSFLLADPAVAALVGNRIYPDDLPQGYQISQGPAIAYTIISTQHGYLINDPDGIARARVEFTAFASTQSASSKVSAAIRKSGLAGLTGDMHGTYVEGVRIDSGEVWFVEQPTDGTQGLRYLTVFDYLIAYQEGD